MNLKYSLYVVLVLFFDLIVIRSLLDYSQSNNNIVFCSSLLIHCTLMMDDILLSNDSHFFHGIVHLTY